MASDPIFVPGMRVLDALEKFRVNVNLPDTIFSTDHWLGPKLDQVRRLISDPITADQALALEEVLHGRRFMKDLIDWLQSPPMTWEAFFPYRKQRKRDELWEGWQSENPRWEKDLQRSRAAMPPCPACGARAVVPVCYGLPSDDTIEAIHRGALDLAIGGCCIDLSSPDHYCRACHHSWLAPRKIKKRRSNPVA